MSTYFPITAKKPVFFYKKFVNTHAKGEKMKSLKSKFCKKIEMLAKAAGGYPERMKLAIYANDESLRTFRPEYTDNKAYTSAMVDLSVYVCKKYSMEVELFEISRDMYTKWLRGRPDTYERRAKYLSLF